MGDYGQVITGQLAGLISFDPSGCARGNDLDRDIYRLRVTFVTHEVLLSGRPEGEEFRAEKAGGKKGRRASARRELQDVAARNFGYTGLGYKEIARTVKGQAPRCS